MGALLATFGAGALGVSTTFAATGTPDHHPMKDLVTAIATKFNVSEASVQEVFDTQRAVRQAERVENHATRLAKAVTDGKLTQAQADAITAKALEEKTFFDGLEDATKEERRAAVKTNGEELKAWATLNAIPKQFIPHAGFEFRGQHGMMGRHLPHPDLDAAADAQGE